MCQTYADCNGSYAHSLTYLTHCCSISACYFKFPMLWNMCVSVKRDWLFFLRNASRYFIMRNCFYFLQLKALPVLSCSKSVTVQECMIMEKYYCDCQRYKCHTDFFKQKSYTFFYFYSTDACIQGPVHINNYHEY